MAAEDQDRQHDRQHELDALRDLVQSDGWKRYREYIESEWGDSACIRKIDEALRHTPAGDDAIVDQTVLQIRASARQIMRVIEWPTERLQILRGQKPATTSHPMDLLRRIARPGRRR